MSEKWTPGPWHWEMADATCMALYGERGELDHVLWSQICDACAERGGRCTAPKDADAHLISSAPELYEALERLYDLLCFVDPSLCSPSYDGDFETNCDNALSQALGALRKARGKTNE